MPPNVAVALDPKLRKRAQAAAKRARLSLSSWISALIARELGVEWEPPRLGRPPVKPKKEDL
jgi:hypothetical protein